ncbi:MAG: IclR family transcriptional regulator [Victivallaceae bacterium]|nr:IclR family transcriptional regulator [Victivallaceae bacterium]
MRIIGSFEKGLNVLEYIASIGGKARTNEVAKACDIPPSNTVLFLNTLIQKGYLIKNSQDGRYYLSNRLAQVAETVSISLYDDLKNIAANVIEELQSKIDENILIAVLNHDMMEFILRRQSTKQIQIVNNIHQFYPPHSTAAGKAILAFLSKNELTDYLKAAEFESYTDKTLTTASAVRQELKQVKKDYYAINHGEYEADIMAVAAPIFLKKKIIASLTVQFPKFRYQDSELDTYVTTIKQHADNITTQLNNI